MTIANQQQADHWNGEEASHWVTHQAAYDRMLAPFTAMLHHDGSWRTPGGSGVAGARHAVNRPADGAPGAVILLARAGAEAAVLAEMAADDAARTRARSRRLQDIEVFLAG